MFCPARLKIDENNLSDEELNRELLPGFDARKVFKEHNDKKWWQTFVNDRYVKCYYFIQ